MDDFKPLQVNQSQAYQFNVIVTQIALELLTDMYTQHIFILNHQHLKVKYLYE